MDQEEKRKALLNNLWQRRVPQFTASYLAGGWTLLQALEWSCKRYFYSQAFVDLFLMVTLGLFPGIFYLVYHHGGEGRQRWRPQQFFLFGLNLLLVLSLAVGRFESNDFQRLVREVRTVDAHGREVLRQVPRVRFIRNVALFSFVNDTGGQDQAWLSYGLPWLLHTALDQNPFYQGTAWLTDQDPFIEAQQAGLAGDQVLMPALAHRIARDLRAHYFINGRYERRGALYHIQFDLYETAGGRLAWSYEGSSAFPSELVDRFVKQLSAELGIHTGDRPFQPLGDLLTYNPNALRHYLVGLRELVNRRYKDAKPHFEASAAADPTFPLPKFQLARVMIESADQPAAEAYFKQGLPLVGRLPEDMRLEWESRYYNTIDMDTEKLERLVVMHSQLNPNDPEIKKRLANFQLEMGRVDEAIELFREVSRIAPADLDNWDSLGSLLIKRDPKEAAKIFKHLETTWPENVTVNRLVAEYHWNVGDHEAAEAAFKRALDLKFDLMVARKLLSFYRGRGNFTAFQKLYEETSKKPLVDHQRIALRRDMFGLLLSRGRLRQAESYEQAARKLDNHQRDLEKANRDIRDSILLATQGKREAAYGILERWRPRFTGSMGYEFTLAEARSAELLEDGETLTRIANQLGDLEAIPKARGRYYEILGLAHLFEGRYAQALAAMEKIPQPYVKRPHYQAAAALRGLGRLAEAETTINAYLRFNRGNGRAFLEAARICETRGKRAEALQHLESALKIWDQADPVFKPARDAQELWNLWHAADH